MQETKEQMIARYRKVLTDMLAYSTTLKGDARAINDAYCMGMLLIIEDMENYSGKP